MNKKINSNDDSI